MFRKNVFASWFSKKEKELTASERVRNSLIPDLYTKYEMANCNVTYHDDNNQYIATFLFTKIDNPAVKIDITLIFQRADEIELSSIIVSNEDCSINTDMNDWWKEFLFEIFQQYHIFYRQNEPIFENCEIKNVYYASANPKLGFVIATNTATKEKRIAAGIRLGHSNTLIVLTKNKELINKHENIEYSQIKNTKSVLDDLA